MFHFQAENIKYAAVLNHGIFMLNIFYILQLDRKVALTYTIDRRIKIVKSCEKQNFFVDNVVNLKLQCVMDSVLAPCFLTEVSKERPDGIDLFKFNNRNSRRRCLICSKLAIKTSERRYLLLTLNIFHT